MTRIGLIWACLAFVATEIEGAEKKLRVLTTFLPGYSVAVNLAGGLADVENLLPGNVSLHDFQLSPGEMTRISRADLIMVNGLGLETFLERAMENAGTAKKTVVLTDGFHGELIEEKVQGHHRAEAGHDHSHDPHIWLDPTLMAKCITNALHGLQRADPKNAEGYAKNAQAYLARLRALHEELLRTLAPVKAAPFITYHNAFRYFVKRYQLNLVAVVEQVPEIPPSTKERAILQQTIREKGVKVLFSEPGANSRLARSIAQDTGIRLAELDPLETGELKADSYERGMRRNAEALLRGLQ